MSEPAVPTLEHRGPFDSRVTAVLAAVWLALLLIQAIFVAQRDPLENLREPEVVITRGVLRQLALELALIETAESATRPLLPEGDAEGSEDASPEPVTDAPENAAEASAAEAEDPEADDPGAPMSRERSTERAVEGLINGARRLETRALLDLEFPDASGAREAEAIDADLDAAERLRLRALLLATESGLERDDEILSTSRDDALIEAVRLSLAGEIDREAARAALPSLEPLGVDYASALAYARLERAAGDREAAEAWEKLRRDTRAKAQAVMVDRVGAWLLPFSLIGVIAGAILLLRGPSAWVLGRGAAPVRGIPTAMGLGAFFRYAIAFQALGSLLALTGNTSVAVSVFVGSLPLLVLLGSIRQSLGGFDIRPLIGLDLAPERTARLIPVALTAWTALLAALVIGCGTCASAR
ncbi:MAG: hypothetical protein ACYS26_16765 [Planctomycetota bacterium]